MPGLKVPKTIRVDTLRRAIGDQKAEDILTVMFGPQLLGPIDIKVSDKIYNNMLLVLEGKQPIGQTYQMLPAILRLYFRENAQAKRRFMAWIRRKLEGTQDATQNGETAIATAAAEMTADAKKPRRKKKTEARRKEHARA